MNSGSGEGESVVEDDWSEGMSESSLRWGLSGLCRSGTTGKAAAAIRWMSSKVMWSMSLCSRRCRRCRHGAGDDVDGAGGSGASSRMGRGQWRPGLRRRRWTRIAAWRSAVEVHGDGETAT